MKQSVILSIKCFYYQVKHALTTCLHQFDDLQYFPVDHDQYDKTYQVISYDNSPIGGHKHAHVMQVECTGLHSIYQQEHRISKQISPYKCNQEK